jgi:hypothetical protein
MRRKGKGMRHWLLFVVGVQEFGSSVWHLFVVVVVSTPYTLFYCDEWLRWSQLQEMLLCSYENKFRDPIPPMGTCTSMV